MDDVFPVDDMTNKEVEDQSGEEQLDMMLADSARIVLDTANKDEYGDLAAHRVANMEEVDHMGKKNCRLLEVHIEVPQMELPSIVTAVTHIATIVGESPPFHDVNLLDVASAEAHAKCVMMKELVSKISVMTVEQVGSYSSLMSTRVEETNESSQVLTFQTPSDINDLEMGQQLGTMIDLTNTISIGEEDSLLRRDIGLKLPNPKDRGKQVAGEISKRRG